MADILLCDLKQYNNSKNQNDRLLDLVLSTMDELRVKEVEPLLKLDGHHPSIEINFNYTNNKPNFVKFNRKFLKPNYHKCNFEKIKDNLRKVIWHELLIYLDSDSAVDAKYIKLNSAILLFAPFKKCNPNQYPYWFNYPLIRCLRDKKKYHKLYKKFGNQRDYDTYMLRTHSKHLIEACYKSIQNEVDNSLGKNVKYFFKFVNNKKSSKGIPESMTHDAKTAKDPQGICELFSAYFVSG
ncbi:unnamed protein product [Parnassius apollo]|uniref:(apollo) hypothetical protein n=1 Tax=Parnassius apollo TaxID=110799 RepID=A0A8S3WAF0_PARAO|nr:unnamed protein product [Parnassius apollo]